jgi:NADH-quinone oxidoreductase subunit L
MFVALGLGAPAAAMTYLFVHAFFKALLFLGAGSVIHATDRQDVSQLGGLWSKMQITSVTFLIGTLAMAGVPLLSGFWAKDEILTAALENRAVLAFLLLSLPLTAMYMTRVFILTFLGEPKDGEAHEHAHEGPPTMWAPLVILAFLSFFAGLIIFDQIGELLGFPGGVGEVIFTHEPHALDFDWWIAIGSSLLVLLGIGAGWYAWAVRTELPQTVQQRVPWLHALFVNKYYLDDIYQGIIDNVVLAGARVLAWFDRNVVNDTGVDGPAYATGFAGYLLKFQQTGKLPNYALGIIVGVVALTVVAFALKG